LPDILKYDFIKVARGIHVEYCVAKKEFFSMLGYIIGVGTVCLILFLIVKTCEKVGSFFSSDSKHDCDVSGHRWYSSNMDGGETCEHCGRKRC
jgi:hypothetical protein